MYILSVNKITNGTYLAKQNNLNFRAVSVPKKITTKTALETYLTECRQQIAKLNPKDQSAIEERCAQELKDLESEFISKIREALKGIEQKWWETSDHYIKRRNSIIDPLHQEED